MALALDCAFVLQQVSKHREFQSYSTPTDVIFEQFYSHSPINYDMLYSLSMEKESDPIQKVPVEAPRHSNSSGPPLEEKSKIVVRNFEPAKDLQKFKFVKETPEKISPAAAPPVSYLRSLLAENRRDTASKYAGLQAAAKLLLTIYLPGESKFVKLKVGEKVLVDEVIAEALRVHAQQSSDDINNSDMQWNPKALILRFAEDDGTPDEDMPGSYHKITRNIDKLVALVRTQEIGQFKGCSTFVLCKDPKYKEPPPEVIPETRVFKVFLPGNSGFVSVLYKDTMTLRELREIVCVKRCLDPDLYTFQLEDRQDFNLNSRLSEFSKEDSINLIEKKDLKRASLRRKGSRMNLALDREVGDAPKQIENRLGAIFFFTPTTATRYKVRYMGIDAERITNTIPDKKGSSAKKPVRYIKDVVRSTLIPNKPGHFLIEFKDKTYKYEASAAEEIVAKITFLTQMINDFNMN